MYCDEARFCVSALLCINSPSKGVNFIWDVVLVLQKLWNFRPGLSQAALITHWLANDILRTAYHQIWLPLTYVEVKCHFTAEIAG